MIQMKNDLESVVRRHCAAESPGAWIDTKTGQVHIDLDFETPVAERWTGGCHLCSGDTPADSRRGVIVFDDSKARPIVYYYEEDFRDGHLAPTDGYELICPRCISWMDSLDFYERTGGKIPYSFAVGDIVHAADGSCKYEIVKRGHTGIAPAEIFWPYYMGRCLAPHTDYVRWLNECQVTKVMVESPLRPTRMLTPLPPPADPLARSAEPHLLRLEDAMGQGGPYRAIGGPTTPRSTGLPRLENYMMRSRLLPEGGKR